MAIAAEKGRLRRPTRSRQRPSAAIEVRVRARQHNLKGIDLDIPRNQMTVCSGPSGSGKSSLAIDTLYAEGQRRYVESLSSYARQFLAPLQKPKVERITGLSPAICIEQKTTGKSPRSTVGTVTEIHDYLRILFARLGQPLCPKCGTAIGTQTADEIVEQVLHLPEGTKVYVMAPFERRDGESYESLWDELRASGFARVRVDGQSVSLDEPPKLSHRRKHKIEVVVDRAIVRRWTRSRLADSIGAALDLGKGVVHIARAGADPRQLLALARAGIQALGEGAQLRRRRIGHGRSVAGRQHLRLEPGERGNGLLRRRPVPGRDPRRARNPLLEPQQIPQGIEIEGQHRIAGDQDPVAGPEKETCPGVWPGVG